MTSAARSTRSRSAPSRSPPSTARPTRSRPPRWPGVRPASRSWPSPGLGGVELRGIEQTTGIPPLADPSGVRGRAERLRRLKRAEPFLPFVVHLSDGRRFPVATASHFMVSPAGGTVVVFGEGDRIDILDTGLITDVEAGPGSPPAMRS